MPVKKKKPVKKRVIKKKSPVKRKVTCGKRSAKSRLSSVEKPVKKAKEATLGPIVHYFPKVNAAVIKLKAPLAAGDTIKIKGHTTDFTQKVDSMQIDHVPITKAKKGDEIGLLVNSRVRVTDKVYKV